MTRVAQTLVGTAAAVVAAVVAGWSACAVLTWLRYGRPRRRPAGDGEIDRFMPACEVAECHEIEVAAPAATTYAAARAMDLDDSIVVRAMFRARELLMGGRRRPPEAAGGLLARTLALGWGVLAEDRGRIVVGAVTQPWRADVRFRPLPPEQFAAFNEPGYAKIVWTLESIPLGPQNSLFRTETRVATTDAASRRRFRLYWSVFSPGILLIRSRSLMLVKAEAERRYRHEYAAGSLAVVNGGEAALDPMEAV